ncbi:trypsin-like peptidase domain-containing protein [Streptomyces sp. NPDC054940]
MNPAGLTGWEGLLKTATVRLHPPSGAVGTGFVVAPGLVVTCAHVIADDKESLPSRVRGRVVALDHELELEPVGDSYVRDRDGGLDMVLLRIADPSHAPRDALRPVLASDVVEIGDDLWTYGHPVGSFHAGQSASLRFEGTDLRSDRAGAPWLPRAKGRVGEGCSGSAVINIRTGAVFGMLSTSDLAGSVHLVPVGEILARCPEGAQRSALDGEWPRRLTRSQLEAAGWGRATPLLSAYLKAAAKAADREHPYPVIEGKAPSALSIVYVRRHAGEDLSVEEPTQSDEQADGEGQDGQPQGERRESEASGEDGSQEEPGERLPDRPESERIPAEELFGLDEDVLLVGSPGAGKSSLLRHAVIELADRWKRRKWHDVVPVRVDAKDFVDAKGHEGARGFGGRRQPLAVIAAAVNDVTAPSTEGWPAQWLNSPPVPGARWLILVDGLDEAGGPEARNLVLQKINDLRGGSTGDNYRFLVATRPLPLKDLPPNLRRFDLLPLDPRQLPAFARGWFTALELDEPGRAAERFMDRLGSSGMAEPARTPLMASMLCQLFAVDQDKPLPRGRSDVYRRFVNAILFEPSWTRPLQPQLRAAADSVYGVEGTTALEKVRNGLPTMVERLALARHEGDKESAVELLADWNADHCPQGLEQSGWAGLLAYALPELLRDSGLLVQRRKDFVFIHQTFAEFLTAKRIADNSLLSDAEFRRLFGHSPRWPAWALRLAVVSEPAANSVARFLIDAWGRSGQRGLQHTLRRLAGGQGGAMLIATLVTDGAQVDDAARESATNVLHTAARRGDHLAAVALARMGDRRGAEILAQMTSRPGRTDFRLNAARGLADLGDPRGGETLRAMAADSSVRVCVPAAEELVRRGDPYGVQVLLGIARDPGAQQEPWLQAARALVRLGLPEGVETLITRMTDPHEPASARIAAAQEVTGPCALQAAEVLADLVCHDLPLEVRRAALTTLRALAHGTPEVTALLGTVAADPRAPAPLRYDAAVDLRDAEQKGRALLGVAEDPAASPELRLRALNRVPAPDEQHATGILLSIVADPEIPVGDRLDAAHRLLLSPVTELENQMVLTSLLTEPALLPGQRLDLVRRVASWWTGNGPTWPARRTASRWWCDTVAALVRDGALPDSERRLLIKELARAGARDSLAALSSSADLPSKLRFLAAREAMRISTGDREPGDPEHGDVRLGLVRDPSLKRRHRLGALAEVAWDVIVPLACSLAYAVKDLAGVVKPLADAVRSGTESLMYRLVQLPFVALLAVLPFVVAVVANSFAVACTAENPPEDWKLRVYFVVTALLVTTLYLGACSIVGAGRKGRKVLLYGVVIAACLGLSRLPGLPALNDMGAYLTAVIPWDGETRV